MRLTQSVIRPAFRATVPYNGPEIEERQHYGNNQEKEAILDPLFLAIAAIDRVSANTILDRAPLRRGLLDS